MKLSPNMVKALHSMLQEDHDWRTRPDGYATAGRDAARWDRTREALAARGLAQHDPQHPHRIVWILTDEGRRIAQYTHLCPRCGLVVTNGCKIEGQWVCGRCW